ncbi:hypothetical protein TWF718_010243 [Orbilia javanica]|uniref:Apple domain-containing protein n=1 Tax=Orbilia javanica TaxID=47235 RepID=A0AAN8R9W5_9PEZI
MRFSILSAIALPVLLGCVDGVSALSCKPAAKSCATSTRQAASCTSLFNNSKSKVKRPTCTVVPAPYTVTKKVTPAASTKVVTITLTASTTKTVSLPTVTVTETRETVEVETSVSSVTVLSTVIDTITTTTTVPPKTPTFTCDPLTLRHRRNNAPLFEVEFDGLVKRAALPKCCECFLTTTKTAARQTKTVTTTLPRVTITKKTTKTVTATRTETATPSSSTVLETITETVVTTRTDIETATETSTETASATETGSFNHCQNPFTYSGRNAFKYSGVTITDGPDYLDTLSKCCAYCWETMNCANYMFDTNGLMCYIYKVTDPNSVQTNCHSELCNVGRPSGTFSEKPTSELYGTGPCAGTIVR